MSNIVLPKEVKYIQKDKYEGTIEILGCYPGYGTTLGNSLRRVLLSSLSGFAVTSIKIKGATHEFVVIDGIMEDVVQIVLNMKKLNFHVFSDDPVILHLKKKGEGIVTTADIKANSDVEIVDLTQKIATITNKKTELEIDITVEKGMGYVPIDQQNREDAELGAIAIDAVYTPIKRVNFDVENMRVGKQTDYEKVLLNILTDGTITPEEAFYEAVEILTSQFNALRRISEERSSE